MAGCHFLVSSPEAKFPLRCFAPARSRFTPEGGEAYLEALPQAEVHRLDPGHFAIEDSLEEIAARMTAFYDGRVAK
jgi:hypothetical protein